MLTSPNKACSYSSIMGMKKVLSGSALKVIAMVSMLIDHLAYFLWLDAPVFFQPLFTIGDNVITPYFLMRMVGRLSFPIFAFLIVEGFVHTRSRRKYGRNLLVFALLSELPWNFVHSGTWHYFGQNVLFTLFFGFLGLCAIEYYKDQRNRLAFSLIGLLVLTVFFCADYGCRGYVFILFLYVLRESKLLQAVIGSCMMGPPWAAGLAFIPINMYNQQRGFIKGNYAKYAIYVFYPLHLLIIFLVRKYFYGF